MRKFNSFYYLLFILLIMGAFAAMAQNRYGLRIIGAVAFAFALVFFIELISLLRKTKAVSVETVAEFICLITVSVIFGLRVFYIHFPFIEWIFVSAAAILTIIYMRRMIVRFKKYRGTNFSLAALVLVFHLGILFFLLSLVFIPFFPGPAEILAALAFIFLLAFFLTSVIRKSYLIEGEKLTPFKAVRNFRDHSVHIVTFFVLFFLYIGLNRIGVIPAIYSDEFPRAYYELVNRASIGEEKPVNSKYQHELFKERYDAFINNVRKK